MGERAEVNQIEIDAESVELEIKGDGSGILIGRHGQTLDALEYIVNRILARRIKDAAPISLETESYRSRRRQQLHRMALSVGERAKREHQPVRLDPMPPRDRRVVHMALKDDPMITTRSAGEGFMRSIEIVPTESGRREPRGDGQNRGRRREPERERETQRIEPERGNEALGEQGGLEKNNVLFFGSSTYCYRGRHLQSGALTAARVCGAGPLVSGFQIAANRLAAHGFGAASPVDSNSTLEGRARNRRVGDDATIGRRNAHCSTKRCSAIRKSNRPFTHCGQLGVYHAGSHGHALGRRRPDHLAPRRARFRSRSVECATSATRACGRDDADPGISFSPCLKCDERAIRGRRGRSIRSGAHVHVLDHKPRSERRRCGERLWNDCERAPLREIGSGSSSSTRQTPRSIPGHIGRCPTSQCTTATARTTWPSAASIRSR